MSSGGYVESFGTRMKQYPRRRGKARPRGWYRVSTDFGSPWQYFQWDQPISGLDRFTSAIGGGRRATEYVGVDRPAGIMGDPFKHFPGGPITNREPIPLFLEKL